MIYTTIFPFQEAKTYINHKFSLPNTQEQFHFPSKRHILSQSELKKIKEHFSTLYDVSN
jgi:hypothetical protein